MSGIVQLTWYYTQCNASGIMACRLPGTIRCLGQTLYQSNIQLDSSNYSMPDMHTAIPCTGSTADQAVSTVHVQLGAAKHLTRPLTCPPSVIKTWTLVVVGVLLYRRYQVSGAASLRVFPGSEFEPLPGTLLASFRPRFLSQVRAISLIYPGTLTLRVNKYSDSVMEYRYITVRPATCRVCSFI